MVKVFINNEITYVPSNSTVLEACESIGIEVPRFCFHERLSVAGNCRMCLVELEKSPKPVASCAMPVMNNMQVFTDTPLVKKAKQRGITTFVIGKEKKSITKTASKSKHPLKKTNTKKTAKTKSSVKKVSKK